MTNEEINELIYTKQLPVSFKNRTSIFYLWIYNNFMRMTLDEYMMGNHDIEFLDWIKSFKEYEINYDDSFNPYIFISRKETIEQCLGEFFIWWEINKNSFTDIKYYEG